MNPHIHSGGFLALLTIAWRNIWRNKRRTALCIVAVAISVFFIIFMQSWIDGMMRGLEEVVRTYESGHVNAVSTRYEAEKEYFPAQFPLADGASAAELVRKIESIEGVHAALPRISVYGTLFDSSVKHALVWGIDIERENSINTFNLTKKSDGIIEGRYPRSDENGCAVGSEMARKAGFKVGDTITLKLVSAQFSDKYWNPVITGIFEFDYQKFDEDTIIAPLERLQRILGLHDATQQIVVYAKEHRMSGAIRSQLQELFGPDNVVREWTDNYWVAMMRSMTGMYIIIFAVFQIVASFLIINTMLMVIHERIKEIGMMGALGMSRTEIVSVFFLEALLLSILGAAAGAIAGGLSAWAGSNYPIDMTLMTGGGMKDLPISGTLYLSFSAKLIAQGFFFGVIVSGLCTLLPSMRSAFIEPVEALRR